MQNFKSSVMVALLPVRTDWSKLELPHLTLVYAGEVKDLKPTAFNELAKDASLIASLSHSIMLKVLGVEVFGDEDKVDVLRFQPTPELWAMRRVVEDWNASEFPFRPHATIGPVGSNVGMETPSYMAFNRIMVGWGDENITFNLKGS